MLKYFNNCKTAEQGKKLYRELAKRYHTDNASGNDEIMKEINSEFSEWWKKHKNIHENESGQSYTKETNETAEEFIDIISSLMKIPHLVIEICGCWIWIGGNTYENRHKLVELGCKWASKKKLWYYTTEPTTHKHKKEYTMNDIRNKYGSNKMKSTSDEYLRINTK